MRVRRSRMFHAIFGFDATLPVAEEWLFNTNHLFLALAVVASVVFLCLIISPKSDVGKKICKLCIAFILLLLEVGRMIYRFRYYEHIGYTPATMNWWLVINFHNCTILTWITIGTLIASCFVEKENKTLQFFYNVMFGCGVLGGLLTFTYPLTLNGSYPIYHFVNMQTIITHTLIIVSPILVVKMGDLKVELKNVWQLFVYYIAVGCIALTASMCGYCNFAFTLYMNWITLDIPFPYHIFVIMGVLVAFETLVYAIFELFRHIRNKRLGIVSQKTTRNKTDLFVTIFMYSSFMLISCVIYSIIAINVWHNEATYLGLLELLTLAYFISGMIYSNHYSRYVTNTFDAEDTKKHVILIICLCIINLPAGIVYLIRYINACKHRIQVS